MASGDDAVQQVVVVSRAVMFDLVARAVGIWMRYFGHVVQNYVNCRLK